MATDDKDDGSNQTNPRVSTVLPGGQEQKEEWDRYADEHPEVSTVSHLIRLSVEKEMDGHHDSGQGGQGAGMGQEVAEKLAEVIETNRDVENVLENLQTRMRSLENKLAEEEEDVADIKGDVFALLPTPDEVESFNDEFGNFVEYAGATLGTEPGDRPNYPKLDTVPSGRPDDIALVVDAESGTVEKALESLGNDTARVRQTDGGSWVKEV